MLVAQNYLALDHKERALDIYYDTAMEIVALDAPALEVLMPQLEIPLRTLRDAGRDNQVKRITEEAKKAERRMRAMREIQQRMVREEPQNSSARPRFIEDQYSEMPYLLYYAYQRDNTLGVAVGLDRKAVVDSFLDTISGKLVKHVEITDTAGTLIAGAPRRGEPDVVVPFSRTFTTLRVGLHAEAVEKQAERLAAQLVPALIITILCSIFGYLAIYAQWRSNVRHQQLLQRQRDFTTRVTHELKTPIAGIKVTAENLSIGAWKSERQREEMAQRIIDEADRLTLRIDEVLAVARKRELPKPEPFDPEEIVLESIDQWGPRLEAGGVRLEADLEATDTLIGDRFAARDAVNCLLDNALKYHDPKREDSKVWIRLYQEKQWVMVSVSDNGIGVPAAMRKQVFERFVRVEGPNRGVAGGHGLGLAQVAEILKAHNGRVRCVEGPAGGAEFVLSFPVP